MSTTIYSTTDDLDDFYSNKKAFKIILTFAVYSYLRYWEKENQRKGRPFYVPNRESLAKRFEVEEKDVEEVFRALTRRYNLGRWLSAKECRWVKTVAKSGHKRVWVSFTHLYDELGYDNNGDLTAFQSL